MQTIIQFRLIDKDKSISYMSDESIKRTIPHRTVAIILRSCSTFDMLQYLFSIPIFTNNVKN